MKFPMRPVAPLALPKTPSNYLIQTKYNGWNVVIDAGRIFTRRGKDITSWNRWEGVNLNPDFPINGELVSVPERLYDLQRVRAGKVPYKIIAFDAMIENMSIEERLSWLKKESLGESVEVCRTFDGAELTTWEKVNWLLLELLKQGREGLVLKEKGSLYHIGEYDSISSPDWIKLKNLIRI